MRIDKGENLVGIEVFDKERVFSHLIFREERKGWFGKIEPAGFYRATPIWGMQDYCDTAEAYQQQDLLVIDNKIYMKPYVILLFNNEIQGRVWKRFDSYNEALMYAEAIRAEFLSENSIKS